MASQVALVVKNSPANAKEVRDLGSIPGLGRSPGGGNGNPFMDRGYWRATIHEVAKSQTWQSTQVHAHIHIPWGFQVLFSLQGQSLKKMCKRESRKTRYLFLQIQINFNKFFFDYLWDKKKSTEIFAQYGWWNAAHFVIKIGFLCQNDGWVFPQGYYIP